MHRSVSDRKKLSRYPRILFQRYILTHGPAGQGIGQQQVFIASLKQDSAAIFARQRSHIDHFIRDGDHIFIVLHHQHRIAFIPQAAKQFGHAVHIPGMHTCTGLIKDIGHTRKGTAHVAHQFQTLSLTAGQSGGFPAHAQIRQADIDHSV